MSYTSDMPPDNTPAAPAPLSVHDNLVQSVFVDCMEKRIVFHTLYEYPDRPDEHTDIVFENVLCYHFANDTMGSVLFDVTEVALEIILEDYAPLFTSGKNYGWPAFVGYKDKADLWLKLTEREIKAFSVSASVGICGFVLAQRMIFSAREK